MVTTWWVEGMRVTLEAGVPWLALLSVVYVIVARRRGDGSPPREPDPAVDGPYRLIALAGSRDPTVTVPDEPRSRPVHRLNDASRRQRCQAAAPAEFTLRAVISGGLGIVFGLVTVYIALEVGLNFSASIPIAVLAITVFKRLGRSSVLEQNIVQTVGSAGESIAAGVVYTMPALLFLGYQLELWRIFWLALVGGVIGRAVHGAAPRASDRQGAREADLP